MKEIKDLLKNLEPVLGSKTKGLWYLSLLSKNSKNDYKSLLRLIADKKARKNYQESILLPPPVKEKLNGDYNIGTVIYPDVTFANYGLNEDEFIKHIMIVGITGSGKTNLSYHVLRQLAKNNMPFMVFDWKRSYRDLKQFPEFTDLKIIRLGSPDSKFKFNPLIPPPGVNPRHWMAMLIDVIKHAFFVAHGVEYFLRRGIHKLYGHFQIYEGEKVYPTFNDLEKIMHKEFIRGRELLWMSSTKRVLASLTFSGLLGDVLDVRTHENIEKLLDQKIIIEMDNLATIEKVFFIEALLLWIYEYRKLESKRECFKHCILIEEAHHVLSKRKELGSGEENVIETIIRMIREFGESIFVIDQEPSKVSDSIKANTNCKICFTLGNGKDISNMAQSMNLTSEQERMIDMLKTGHAIVKLKNRFTEPIHVKIPHVKIKKGMYSDHKSELNDSIGIP